MVSVSKWLPDCHYRPQSFTTDFNEGFRSSFIHLCACLLHTDSSYVSKADIENVVSGLSLTAAAPLGPASLSKVKSDWGSANMWKSSSIIACNTIYIDSMYKHYEAMLSIDPTAVLDHSKADVMVYMEGSSSGHDVSLDEYLVDMMGLVAEFAFEDIAEAKPHLVLLEKVWKKYGEEWYFARGRGDKYYIDVKPDQYVIVNALDEIETYAAILLKPFVLYHTNENFSFKSVTKKFRHVAGIASHFAKIASKMIWSNIGEITSIEAETALNAAIGTLSDIVGGETIDAALPLNIANSSIEQYIKLLSPHTEKFIDKLPGCLACFYNNKKADDKHNPKVGRHDADDTTKATWREKSDGFAMQLADLAIDLYSKVSNKHFAYEHNQAIEKILDLEREIDAGGASMKGRAPGQPRTTINRSNDDDDERGMYFEEYFRANREKLIRAAELPIDVSDDEARSVLLYVLQVGGDMGLFGNFDNTGDLVDFGELEQINAELEDEKAQVVNLSNTIDKQSSTITSLQRENTRLQRDLDMAASTGVVPRASSTGRYVNWDAAESDELLTAVNAKWMDLRDAYELIDALNGFNFKYDSARDSARELLTEDQFSVNLPIGQSQRFPQDLTYVCQSNQEVISAISDVLASLNFKNDEDTRGPRENKQAPAVRATTQYNDAALAYVKSVSSLSKVFGRSAYSRGKFERKFGLHWM